MLSANSTCVELLKNTKMKSLQSNVQMYSIPMFARELQVIGWMFAYGMGLPATKMNTSLEHALWSTGTRKKINQVAHRWKHHLSVTLKWQRFKIFATGMQVGKQKKGLLLKKLHVIMLKFWKYIPNQQKLISVTVLKNAIVMEDVVISFSQLWKRKRQENHSAFGWRKYRHASRHLTQQCYILCITQWQNQ